ncbi:uncharacterized protein AB675_10741 [Cyphellophora attinorum]|uniref:Uncharacterized protein n=1 Tax=Cyphellophora attinorum TaxID=1664694 RepID=A0A0N0NMX3_9EURO|nr:uncharacterized protein AB675_10741 [Phialophora attinorum]KPI40848.1 hypothetical protein AB675_10741 [Phialophora attinorum]
MDESSAELASITRRAELPHSTAFLKPRQDQQDESYTWNTDLVTCGYFRDSDNRESTYTCGTSCQCGIGANPPDESVFGVCGVNPSTELSCLYSTKCYDNGNKGRDNELYCEDYPDRPHCVQLSWTDLHVTAWTCMSEAHEKLELGYNSADPITPASDYSSTSVSDSATDPTTGPTRTSSSSSKSLSRTSPRPTSALTSATGGGAVLPSQSSGSSSRIPAAAIGGIAGGCVALLAVVIAVMLWIRSHRKTKQENHARVSTMGNEGPVGPLPLPFPPPTGAVEKDAEPAPGGTPKANPSDQTLPPSRGTNGPVSPVSSPSLSPAPNDKSHFSAAISSLNSDEIGRLSTQPSFTSLGTSAYKAFSSNHVHQLPTVRDPPPYPSDSMVDRSWYDPNRASELPGVAIPYPNRNTVVSELMGSVPESRGQR